MYAGGQELIVEVTDDGVGIGSVQRRSGLDKLLPRCRAENLDGTLIVETPSSGWDPIAMEDSDVMVSQPIRCSSSMIMRSCAADSRN